MQAEQATSREREVGSLLVPTELAELATKRPTGLSDILPHSDSSSSETTWPEASESESEEADEFSELLDTKLSGDEDKV